MTHRSLARRRDSTSPVAEVQKIGNHTYSRLTNEEALAKYGSSFVFVGRNIVRHLTTAS